MAFASIGFFEARTSPTNLSSLRTFKSTGKGQKPEGGGSGAKPKPKRNTRDSKSSKKKDKKGRTE